MYQLKMCWCVVLAVLLFVQFAQCHPLDRILSREKRMSDQRLAELETLIALAKMKHKLVTVPVGFGRVDPAKLGRRRRSVAKLLRNLAHDVASSSEDDAREAEEQRVDENEKLLINLLYNEEFGESLRTND